MGSDSNGAGMSTRGSPTGSSTRIDAPSSCSAGGPISSDNDEAIALLMVEAASQAEARVAFVDDPWTTMGVFRIRGRAVR
jgi:hypothetical protein